MTRLRSLLLAGLLVLSSAFSSAQQALPTRTNSTQEITYTLDRKSAVPWSVHVIRVPRRSGAFEIHSTHATGRAIGLATLTEQATSLRSDLGIAMAAINGDFYQRQGSYLGNPRGLQILEGELISAPVGSASFWVDASGQPHIGITESLFRVTWPNGSSAPIGLNETRRANGIVLYTPALGPSTRTRGGRELILEKPGDVAWLPLRTGRVYRGRIREVRNGGNTPITAETLVLSIGPSAVVSPAQLTIGSDIQISTATTPNLRGAITALSGGPILVRGGKAQSVRLPDSDTYEFGSATERHPRSAVGWNDEYVFFVEVDGRQRLSVGMTLRELAAYMARLGCTEAMNLDGGGSATLWYAGQIRNRPCDGHERLLANGLVAVRKKNAVQAPASATPGSN